MSNKQSTHWLVKSPETRFEQNSVRVTETGCRIWLGPSVPRGYGVMSINGKQKYTHRIAWELKNGPIPAGMHVLHDCDVPACINVDHLHLGTNRDNINEKILRNRCKSPTGEFHGSAKLTNIQVEYIRKVYVPYDKHFSSVPLAKKLGVSPHSVYAAAKRITWRHI